jgi:hypothetical protein
MDEEMNYKNLEECLANEGKNTTLKPKQAYG